MSSTSAPMWSSTLRSSACAQTAPKRPVLAPMTRTGLPREGVVGEGPRGPVDRVLQHAGDRGVVLGGADQRRVRRGDRLAQAPRPPRARVRVEVLVVGRQLAESSNRSSSAPGGSSSAAARSSGCCGSHSAASRRCRGPSSLRVSSGLTSSRWMFSVTSQSRTSPPPGSSICQSKPKSRRSNVVSSSKAARSPVETLDRRACRCPSRSTSVLPAIVSSPSTLPVPSSLELDARRAERDLGVVLGVEELLARARGRGTPRARGSRSTRPWRRPRARGSSPSARQRRADVVERASKGGDAVVEDREAEHGVDGVGLVCAFETPGRCCHLVSLVVYFVVENLCVLTR